MLVSLEGAGRSLGLSGQRGADRGRSGCKTMPVAALGRLRQSKRRRARTEEAGVSMGHEGWLAADGCRLGAARGRRHAQGRVDPSGFWECGARAESVTRGLSCRGGRLTSTRCSEHVRVADGRATRLRSSTCRKQCEEIATDGGRDRRGRAGRRDARARHRWTRRGAESMEARGAGERRGEAAGRQQAPAQGTRRGAGSVLVTRGAGSAPTSGHRGL